MMNLQVIENLIKEDRLDLIPIYEKFSEIIDYYVEAVANGWLLKAVKRNLENKTKSQELINKIVEVVEIRVLEFGYLNKGEIK